MAHIAIKQQLDMNIRWLIRRDMPAVLDIEQENFEFPWSEEDFTNCFQKKNCIGLVVEHDEQIIGYAVYELEKTLLHIVNLAVSTKVQRQGVGRRIIEKLVSKLSKDRRQRITLQVSEANLSAQLFFKSMGFWAISVIDNHFDNSTAAYEMELWHTD